MTGGRFARDHSRRPGLVRRAGRTSCVEGRGKKKKEEEEERCRKPASQKKRKEGMKDVITLELSVHDVRGTYNPKPVIQKKKKKRGQCRVECSRLYVGRGRGKKKKKRRGRGRNVFFFSGDFLWKIPGALIVEGGERQNKEKDRGGDTVFMS